MAYRALKLCATASSNENFWIKEFKLEFFRNLMKMVSCFKNWVSSHKIVQLLIIILARTFPKSEDDHRALSQSLWSTFQLAWLWKTGDTDKVATDRMILNFRELLTEFQCSRISWINWVMQQVSHSWWFKWNEVGNSNQPLLGIEAVEKHWKVSEQGTHRKAVKISRLWPVPSLAILLVNW